MAAGSPIGHIGLWDLEDKKLLGQMRDAHSTAISGISFVQGEPILITNGSDNAIRVRCVYVCVFSKFICFIYFSHDQSCIIIPRAVVLKMEVRPL